MEAYPHPDRLLRELNEVLTDGTDNESVTVEQGILRRACWHLRRLKLVSQELKRYVDEDNEEATDG